jgi:hypothetical protein
MVRELPVGQTDAQGFLDELVLAAEIVRTSAILPSPNRIRNVRRMDVP